MEKGMVKPGTARLVMNAEQARSNIVRFERELERNPSLADIMAYGRAWYACRSGDKWVLAPSKFAGYAENDGRIYLATHRERDGRVTERVLSHWFEVVPPSTSIYEELYGRLRDIFARFGKTPNKSLRLN